MVKFIQNGQIQNELPSSTDSSNGQMKIGNLCILLAKLQFLFSGYIIN
jgi:hypothetical protein